ncbi:MAG: universal stress protein, partial [Dehalococcoidia bacterium]
IAMTTHGRSGIGRWLMGSVTDKVVREAETPVLVVRAQEAPPPAPRFQRIILPLDGSALAEQAIPSATALAKGLGVPVTALRSISLTAYGYGFADYSVPEYSMGSFAETVRKDVKDYMDHTADRLRQQGVMAAEISAPDGQPADAILAEAESAPGSLIVMTTRGRSGVARWVLGSVADRVVRHAPVPMLIIRAEDG